MVAVFALFLIRAHYVKVYSDPVGWLLRAERMAAGHSVTSRPPVYPVFLIGALKILGPYYVFLSNLPLLLLMALLTYLLTVGSFGKQRGLRRSPGVDAGLAGLTATGILVVLNGEVFLEMLNPFREALAFTLMLSSLVLILSFLDVKKPWKVIVAGLLLGLSIGARETCVLVLPPLGMLFLYSIFTDRDLRPFRTASLFCAGLLLGLTPLFYQNAVHTGHFWLPSYAASRFQASDAGDSAGGSAVALVKPDDFPVPGMGLTHFSKTGRKTVLFFFEKYRWWGLSLLLMGMLQSLRRRYVYVFLLLLPSAGLHFFFYCFYRYIKARYLFAIDLFVVPVMGIGLVALLTGAAVLLGKVRKGKALSPVPVAVLLTVLMVVASVQHVVRRGSGRFQVWDVKELHEKVLPRIETPFRMISPRRHHRQLLSWLFRSPYVHDDVGIDRKNLAAEGFEEAMRAAAAEYLSSYGETNTYSYSRISLLESWFDFEEVLSFSDIPAAPDLYGERMTDTLYRVVPWSKKEILRQVEVDSRDGKKLLIVDLFRLWDYPERTFCRLEVGGEVVEARVPNGLHFVEIQSSLVRGGKIGVRIISDAPLPEEPLLETRSIDEPWKIPLGAGSKYWYYPYLSHDLLQYVPLKAGSTVLFDKGTVTLPKFAGKEKEAFATFLLEFFQEEVYFRKPNSISLDGGGGSRERTLPGRRRTDWVTVSLDRGGDRLEMVPVTLVTSLPTREEQLERWLALETSGFGYVKLFSVHVTSVSATLEEKVEIDVGAFEDGPWLKEGFFLHEKFHRRHPVRWTSGRAGIRLPRIEAGSGVEVGITIREGRPGEVRAVPHFVVNGEPVPAEEVTMRELDDNGIEYRFRSDGGNQPAQGMGEVEILVEPWVPSRVTGSGDSRELGILLDRVEFLPLPFLQTGAGAGEGAPL